VTGKAKSVHAEFADRASVKFVAFNCISDKNGLIRINLNSGAAVRAAL
jgi:hypothetical protein